MDRRLEASSSSSKLFGGKRNRFWNQAPRFFLLNLLASRTLSDGALCIPSPGARARAMPIVYSLIARGTTVFCEHTGDRGNFQQITRTILEKVDNSADAKHSYSYDDHTFHMIVEHGIIYLAMSTREFELSAAFGFLGQIKRQFDQRYQDIFSTAVAFEMNKTFNKVLTEQMDAYNNGGDVAAADSSDRDGGNTIEPARDKIDKVRAEIDEVRTVMTDNIDRILDRGDKIDLLVDKSEGLLEQASKFKKSSAQLQRKMWWANAKLQMCAAGGVTGALVVVVLSTTKCFGSC